MFALAGTCFILKSRPHRVKRTWFDRLLDQIPTKAERRRMRLANQRLRARHKAARKRANKVSLYEAWYN